MTTVAGTMIAIDSPSTGTNSHYTWRCLGGLTARRIVCKRGICYGSSVCVSNRLSRRSCFREQTNATSCYQGFGSAPK